MHLLKFSQSAVSRLMRLADQVSFGLLVAGTTMLPASAASGTTVWTTATSPRKPAAKCGRPSTKLSGGRQNL